MLISCETRLRIAPHQRAVYTVRTQSPVGVRYVTIQSMTGYGENTVISESWEICVRLKTLNHRHLDSRISGLDRHPLLQLKTREFLQQAFARGRVDLDVELRRTKQTATLRFDVELAAHYLEDITKVSQALGLNQVTSLEFLLEMEGVMEREFVEEDTLWAGLQTGLQEAVSQARAMRVAEGQRLEQELLGFVAELRRLTQEITSRMPELKETIRGRLLERIASLYDEVNIDEGRLEEEVILYVERGDVSEELARLDSHFEGVDRALTAGKPAGKVLEFLAQELGREINTVGAKSKDALISHHVIEMKSILEKFREQVRNIE